MSIAGSASLLMHLNKNHFSKPFHKVPTMNMKLLFRWFSSILMLTILLGQNILSVNAQTSGPGDDVISFQTMGEQDTILSGPLDSRSILFRLPADWSMQSD